jgi:3-oxoadipate enol-lactonase
MDAHLNGMRMHWVEAGDADSGDDVVLLVHGFPFNASMWQPQLDAPPPGWRMIAPDLRGFGRNEPAGPDALTMERHAEDLAALLRHLGLTRAVVCGLSMGGYIAFALWRHAPELVRAFVLSDTRPGADTEEARRGRVDSARAVSDDGPAALIDGMLPKLLSERTRADRPEVERGLRRMMASAPRPSLAAALLGMAGRPDSTDLLPDITVPTQVVVGADDPITPPEDARLMADRIPDARLHVIEGAAHVPNLEQPAEFNRVLAEFLETLA